MSGHIIINGKPGDRYVTSGHGWGSRGSWRMEPVVHEMGEDGEWRCLGTLAEVEAADKKRDSPDLKVSDRSSQ